MIPGGASRARISGGEQLARDGRRRRYGTEAAFQTMRVVKVLMMALLLYAAVLQYNDPDGIYWAVLYALAAAVTGLSFVRPIGRIAFAAFLAYAVATIVVAIGVDRWSVGGERAREAAGVAICAVWMMILSRAPGKRPASSA